MNSVYSRFTLAHAILMKHWTVPNILENMEKCAQILKESGCDVPQKNAILF